jgi:hypothetical protein
VFNKVIFSGSVPGEFTPQINKWFFNQQSKYNDSGAADDYTDQDIT